MAETLTVKPYKVYYRYESGKWSNAARLWDNDNSTAPTSQSGAILLEMDLSEIPANARITKCDALYWFKRGGSSMNPIRLIGTNYASYSSGNTHECASIDLPNGTYNVAEAHNGSTTDISADYLSYTHKLVAIPNIASGTGYEVTLTFTYETDAVPTYVGDTQATEVYVGDKKATALYIGTTKVM